MDGMNNMNGMNSIDGMNNMNQGLSPENAQLINNMNNMANLCNSVNNGDNSFANFGFVMGAGIEGGADSMPMQMGAMFAGISAMNNAGSNVNPFNDMGMNSVNGMGTTNTGIGE